jgi:uncharacterized membrane protein
LLTFAAMGISAYLAWNSFTGGRAVGCGPESGCDKVLQSRWAWWFGAPVSLFALAVYSLILGASFRLGAGTPPEIQRKAWGWLVPCALVVAGAAIWFVGLQVFSVKAVCAYCMAAHASGFMAAALLLAGAPFRNAPAKPWESERQVYVTPRVVRRAAAISVLALAALVGGQFAQKHHTPVVTPIAGGGTNTVTPDRIFSIYDRFQLNLREVPMLGTPTNAQVAVSLFDYTCHHCRTMHPLLVEAQRQFGSSLAIVGLPMPLDPGCNQTVKRHYPPHTNACDYARIGLAVWRANREKHHDFDQWVMAGENPPPLPETRQHAAQLVGADALEKALRDPWVEETLRTSVGLYEVAYRAGQGSMPQLIIGQSVAVGSYLQADLIKMFAENLGLPMPAAPVQSP